MQKKHQILYIKEVDEKRLDRWFLPVDILGVMRHSDSNYKLLKIFYKQGFISIN